MVTRMHLRITAVLRERDDLRRAPWRGSANLLAGHCYVASEVVYHLWARRAGYRPATVHHEGAVHWFLIHRDGRILDLTASQFSTLPPYALARCRGFLTSAPSKRAMAVLEALGE